jgi:hypothetical protein
MKDRDMMFTMADTGHQGVSPEKLKMLGKRASALYTEKNIPLTDAVVNVLSDESGLNRQHVQRVTEFANTFAFEDMFQKQAGHKVVDFGEEGPADTSEVMKELGAQGQQEHIKSASVVRPPKRRFVPGQDSARDFGSMTKTASAIQEYPQADPYSELGQLRDDVKKARDEMLTKVAESSLEYDAAANHLYQITKQAVLSGHSPAEIAVLFEQRSSDVNMVKLALREIASRMDSDAIPAVPLSKMASNRVVNENHPLLRSFQTFTKVAQQHFTHMVASENLSRKYHAVDRKVRDLIQ